MDGHFRAFSFVDRITAFSPGRHVRGRYTIPADLTSFPAALVAEAVGQLAAWAAMSALEFKSRPVAGLAAGVDFLSPVRPGQVLELTAELETLDADAVAYGGVAEVDGQPVIRLRDCVGPMLPVEEFDDPQALRDRFDLLRHGGATPGLFAGLPALAWDDEGREDGQWTRATLRVPYQASFFADHFPRRPVFPGTLLMNAKLELVAALAATLPPCPTGRPWALRSVADMKLRAFAPPGATLEAEARLTQRSDYAAIVHVESREGKRIIGGARVQLVPEGCA